ncbi:hypothetical protein P4S72_15850 [Vibrio sp. PP-XX7]
MPHTAVYGALLVLLCDVVGRVIIFPYEIPISTDHEYCRWGGVCSLCREGADA